MEIREGTHLYDLLEKYSNNDEHLGKSLVALQEKTKNQDIYVPFLGVQGAGKSTLINSLLGEDILPNEADETTCIPVEVRFAEEDSAEAYLKDGKKEILPTDKDAIAKYVDNKYNPGNEKGISRIVLKRNYEILKSGLIIVDLPGVGSLTHENEETTVSYVQHLSAAVFLFSTTPPILKKDAAFIKSIWRGVNNAFFVQNVWTDNSESETKEGLDHNKNILISIAREIGANFDGGIIPVNVYNAAYGRFHNDSAKISESKVKVLESELTNFAIHYKEQSEINYRKRVQQALEYVKDEIEERISQSTLSYEDVLDELNEKKQAYEERNDEIRTIGRRIDDTIYESKKVVKTFAKDIAEKKTNLLRTEMHELIKKGIVDGEKLDTAFADYQRTHEEEVSEETFELLEELGKKLQEDYDKLFFELERAETIVNEGYVLNKKEKYKWEKWLKGGLALGADVGGAFAGVAIGTAVAEAIGAGAAAGAAAGTPAGPIGWAIGAAAGITISLLGLGVATIAKKSITKKRGEETKAELETYLNQYQQRIETVVRKYSDQYFDTINRNVKDYISSMKKVLDSVKDEISELRRSGQKMQYSENELREDLAYIKKWSIENE